MPKAFDDNGNMYESNNTDKYKLEPKQDRENNLSAKKLEKEKKLESKIQQLKEDLETIATNPDLNIDTPSAIQGKKNVENALMETQKELDEMKLKHDYGAFKFYTNKIRNALNNVLGKKDVKRLSEASKASKEKSEDAPVSKDSVEDKAQEKNEYAKEEAILFEDNPHVETVGEYVAKNAKKDFNEFKESLMGKTNSPEVAEELQEEREDRESKITHRNRDDISKDDVAI